MEMQNVLQQMANMLSSKGSNDMLSVSSSTNTTGERFHSVMSSQMSKKSTPNVGEQSVKDDVANTVGVQTVNEKRQQELVAVANQDKEGQETVTGNKDVQEVQEEDLTPEEMETAAQWMGTVQQQICQELSIAPEELEGVMEQLGLQLSDLQDIGSVQQLVLAVSGEDSVTALLTNEELSDQVQNILQVVVETTQQITEQLQISEDEFAQLLDKAGAVIEVQNADPQQMKSARMEQELGMASEVEGVQQENATFVQESSEFAQNKEETDWVAEVSIQQQEEGKDIVLETDEQSQEVFRILEAVTVEQTDNSKEEKESMNPVIEDTLDIDTKQIDITNAGISSQKESNGEAENFSNEDALFGEKGQQQKDAPVMEHVMNQVFTAKAQFAETVQERVQITQQMQEIFEQVVEQLRVTVTEDTSEMVMQLNPENLGKVNLSVVAKEGHITAQFVTENEVARQALESQIQQLRETLGEQGLKVDKVEVSVSDFNFQNGNQANAEEQKQQQRDEHAKQVHRNLNLASLEDLEDMTEAEELAVKIMQSNGNQIDYTA